MFTVLGIIWLAIGVIPLIRTLRRANRLEKPVLKKRLVRNGWTIAAFIVLLIGFNVFFYITTEYQWFASLGYAARFWTEISAKVLLFAAAGVVAAAFVFLNLQVTSKSVSAPGKNFLPAPAAVLLGVILGSWALGSWDKVLLFLNQADSAVRDPVFGRTTSYYLFSLPVYTELLAWLVFLIVATAAAVIALTAIRMAQAGERERNLRAYVLRYRRVRKQLFVLAGLFLLTRAGNSYLNIFELMYSPAGAVTGAGWLAVNVRQPAYYVSVAIYTVSAILLFWGAFRDRVTQKLFSLKRTEDGTFAPSGKTLLPIGIVVGLLILVNGVIPGLFRTLYVNPNEITLEEPYIGHNIEFTRVAFGIDDSRVDRTTIPVTPGIGAQAVRENRETLENIRLWDWRALQDNLSQRQEIRLYYRFRDVDVDRYTIDGEYRQMMLSVRELDKAQLPARAQTWVSRQLKYTHGYGLVMLPVAEFLPNGQPNLLLRNIPVEIDDELEQTGFSLTRPEIYYGEMTDDHVYVRTTEQEFHYPAEDENVFITYEGDGGVLLDNLLKRFVFAWKFDGVRQLFSGYFTPESRIMFHREIDRRASRLAPFLVQDRDPYPVVTNDGRIKFIIDTYITSRDYPYSEPYTGRIGSLRGANYVRNSVKVVIDAYDGTVDYYVFDPDDIIIRTYQNVFPGLFKSADEMPENLRAHVRYPEDYLTAQAEMYRVYQMTDARTFYQREDVWEFATERYREAFQDVTPYYIMITLPGGELEFVLMVPFTPRDRNVMNAWMAGRSDAPNYGRITVYAFPKGVEVLGPRQIEARVDQNAEMSQQLSLWDQRGSQIIRGNLLTVPLFREDELSVLFAEPVFLQAAGAELPEIRRVILADQDEVVWSPTFEQTLNLLVGRAVAEPPHDVAPEAAPAISARLQNLVDDAIEAFTQYKEELADGNFQAAGEHLDRLNSVIGDIEVAARADEGVAVPEE